LELRNCLQQRISQQSPLEEVVAEERAQTLAQLEEPPAISESAVVDPANPPLPSMPELIARLRESESPVEGNHGDEIGNSPQEHPQEELRQERENPVEKSRETRELPRKHDVDRKPSSGQKILREQPRNSKTTSLRPRAGTISSMTTTIVSPCRLKTILLLLLEKVRGFHQQAHPANLLRLGERNLLGMLASVHMGVRSRKAKATGIDHSRRLTCS
jgi:hypothetical protein